MKKLNRGGFVLAESIVVSVFVLGIFTYLAVNVIPLVTQYDRVINYDNPQEVYAANILFEEMNAYYNEYSFGTENIFWRYWPQDASIMIDLNHKDEALFKQLFEYLNIKNIASVSQNCDNLGRGMTEYCNYKKNRNELYGVGVSLNGINYVFRNILIQFKNDKFASFKVFVLDV